MAGWALPSYHFLLASSKVDIINKIKYNLESPKIFIILKFEL